jgi:hypothetical protein
MIICSLLKYTDLQYKQENEREDHKRAFNYPKVAE